MTKFQKFVEILRIISDSLLSIFLTSEKSTIEMSTRRERERKYRLQEICKVVLDLLLMRKWDRLVLRMATAILIVAILSTNWTDEKMDPFLFIGWLCAAIAGTTFIVFCLNLLQEMRAEREERAFHAAKAFDIGTPTEFLNRPAYQRVTDPDWREKVVNASEV